MSSFRARATARPPNAYLSSDAAALALLARVVGRPDRFDAPWAADMDALAALARDMRTLSREGAPPHSAELLAMLDFELDRLRQVAEYPGVAGKVVVALGGGFSAGKSSFLNALLGSTILPTDINPTTSVPTYVVQGEAESLCGLNCFGHRVELDRDALMAITHDFADRYKVGFGHLLASVFVSMPGIPHERLAFLDTPGYSKPDHRNHAATTDEAIARKQLQAADCIIWLVDTEQGGLTADDLDFLRSVQHDGPLLVVLNKVDKRDAETVAGIRSGIQRDLETAGFSAEALCTFSAHDPDDHDTPRIQEVLAGWNPREPELLSARNIRKVFRDYERHYEAEVRDEQRRLTRVNRLAVNLAPRDDDSRRDFEELKAVALAASRRHEGLKARLEELNAACFVRLASVGALIGQPMPSPDELDRMDEQRQTVPELLRAMRAMQGDTRESHLATTIEAVQHRYPLDGREASRAAIERILARHGAEKKHIPIRIKK
jgi:hypothetical protein